jgi:hypothetical protein
VTFIHARIIGGERYCLGYLFGLAGIVYVGLTLFITRPELQLRVLYIIVFINFFFGMSIPSYAKI